MNAMADFVVDAFDDVYAYGRMGAERVLCYLDDLSPEIVAKIHKRIPDQHGSVLVTDVNVMPDWRSELEETE